MDIFNRKKLADAEAKIRWWMELNNQQYDELQAMSDKLRTAENKIIKYQQMHEEDIKNFDKLKQDYDALNASCQVLTYKLKSNKRTPSAYNEEVFQQDWEIDDEIKEIDNVENKSKTKSAPYTIRKEVVDGIKKVDSTQLMSALYKNKKFFSKNEFNFYELLMPLIQSNGLVLLSKVRLADIVELWEEFYDDKAKEIEKRRNPLNRGKVFLNALSKNSIKSLINKRMVELNPEFSNSDYLIAFLYPLFRLHIDFLICKCTDKDVEPMLVIELNGKEHYIASQNGDSAKTRNDKFKEAIFRSKAVKIGFLTIYNDLLYKNRDELSKIMEDILSHISEGHNEINWTDIQINLSELAKPYIEEIGK